MSTRSNIIVSTGPDTSRGLFVYCHSDGYLSYTGRILLQHYSSHELALALVRLGDLSIVGPRLAPEPDEPHGHGISRSYQVTCAYHRDRGEPWATVAPREVALLANGFPDRDALDRVPFRYFHDGARWWVHGHKWDEPLSLWEPLTDSMVVEAA